MFCFAICLGSRVDQPRGAHMNGDDYEARMSEDKYRQVNACSKFMPVESYTHKKIVNYMR